MGRVGVSCCGMCSGPLIGDLFRADVVELIQDPWCGTCSGPMLWHVFKAHVAGHVRGPSCETWSVLMCEIYPQLDRVVKSSEQSCLSPWLPVHFDSIEQGPWHRALPWSTRTRCPLEWIDEHRELQGSLYSLRCSTAKEEQQNCEHS